MTPSLTPELARRVLDKAYAQTKIVKQRQESADRCRALFRNFVAEGWHVVEPAKEFMPSWHVEAICDHMQAVAEGHIQNLLITVPPGTGKSIVVSVMFPAWMWTHNPGWRSTWASYDSGLSTRDSVRCRGVLESAWYQDTFHPEWKFATDQNEKTYYANTQKGFRVSTSVGGRGTGWRGNFFGVDDPLNALDQFSDAKLEEVWFWWSSVVFNRLNDMKIDARVAIMQRLSDRDLAGQWLRTGEPTHLLIPMEYDPTRSRVTVLSESPLREWRDPRTVRDELMFPALFPRDVVDRIKKNPSAYAGQYQQMPNVEGGGILKSHKWRYWQPAGDRKKLPAVRIRQPDGTIKTEDAVDLPDTFDLQLQSWDMAFKDLKTSDFVVGQTIGVSGANRYILHQIRDRMNLPATISAVRRMTGLYPKAHLKLVEDKANGSAVIQMLNDEISGLVPVNPQDGKVSRASAASVELESGNWFLPHPMMADWVGDPENPTVSGFLAETVMFPNGQNDDSVDSWSQAALRIQSEKIGGVFGVTEQHIRVDPFEYAEKWPRLFGLSVNFREIGAVWLIRKPDTGEHYLYAEYGVPLSDPAQHATEIRKQGDWITGYMTAEDTGRDKRDGLAMATKFRSMGLKIEAIQDSSETMLLDVQEGLQQGKLKVFGNLATFFDQYRMFRRNDKHKLPEYNCAVIWAMCIAWKARSKVRGPVEHKPQGRQLFRTELGGNGWMGS